MANRSSIRASFSRLDRWAIGLNVLLSVVALLTIVVLVNYLASRHSVRLRWGGETSAPLSPLTRGLLETLTNRVKVMVFYDPDPQSTVFQLVKGLIAEYQLACPRITVEYVDYLRDPSRAAEVKGQYRLPASADADLVIFDHGGVFQVVRDKELSDYSDLSEVFQGEPIRRTAFKGEQAFTSALINVTDPRPFRAYYLLGHGEHDPTSEDPTLGYRKFASVLLEKKIVLSPLSLRTNDVPDDCQLLIVAGPRYPLPPAELRRLGAYVSTGGRALILLPNPLQPGVRRSGVEEWLLDGGVEVGDNLVTDPAQADANAPQVLLTSQFGRHPVVRPLQGARVGLVMPRSVRRQAGSPRRAEAAKVEELAFTSPEGKAWSQVRDGRGTVETNGVLPLMVAVEKGTIAGISPDRGSTRLVVAGESLFLANAMIDIEANRDFASLAINWLLDRRQLLEIGPRPIREYRVTLSKPQMRTVRWILLVALPGSVLLLGLGVWVRRRR
jgi:hypothetical protein